MIKTSKELNEEIRNILSPLQAKHTTPQVDEKLLQLTTKRVVDRIIRGEQ